MNTVVHAKGGLFVVTHACVEVGENLARSWEYERAWEFEDGRLVKAIGLNADEFVPDVEDLLACMQRAKVSDIDLFHVCRVCFEFGTLANKLGEKDTFASWRSGRTLGTLVFSLGWGKFIWRVDGVLSKSNGTADGEVEFFLPNKKESIRWGVRMKDLSEAGHDLWNWLADACLGKPDAFRLPYNAHVSLDASHMRLVEVEFPLPIRE